MSPLKNIGVTMLIAVPLWSVNFMVVLFVEHQYHWSDSTTFFGGIIISSTITVYVVERSWWPWWYVLVGNVAWLCSVGMISSLWDEIDGRGPVGMLVTFFNIKMIYVMLLIGVGDYVLPCAFIGTLFYILGKKVVHRLAEMSST